MELQPNSMSRYQTLLCVNGTHLNEGRSEGGGGRVRAVGICRTSRIWERGGVTEGGCGVMCALVGERDKDIMKNLILISQSWEYYSVSCFNSVTALETRYLYTPVKGGVQSCCTS